MPAVTLQAVTVDNWQVCSALAPQAVQSGFVAPPLDTIAEAQFYPDSNLRAVVNSEGVIVGLVWYGWSARSAQYKIVRLLIDQHYQGQGYGRAAMEAVLADFRTVDAVREVWLSYRDANSAARRLYQSLGFQEQTHDA